MNRLSRRPIAQKSTSAPPPSTVRRGESKRLGPTAAKRGSVLVVALLLAAMVALALGSYLSLNLNSARMARRSFQQQAALNLAEAGAEEALWSFNRAAQADKEAWEGWDRKEPAAWRRFEGFHLNGQTAGNVRVYIDNIGMTVGARPHVVALASVETPGQTAVTKMLEVMLARRSPFANGLMARDRITFSGKNVTVDSWDSDPDRDASTPPVPYDPGRARDNGSVASTSVENTAVLMNQTRVWGTVATGGVMPEVGRHGSIGPFGTPAGTIAPGSVSTDFSAYFPDYPAPSDGVFLSTIPAVLGTSGKATSWRSTSLKLSGNQSLTIAGDVVLVLTNPSGTSAVDVTGRASIIIPLASSLTLYAEGDVLIAGNGVANQNAQPRTFRIWGTNTSEAGQSIHVAGNGALLGTVYAPRGDVKINGNADMMGAVVGREITITGEAAFHYDEALAYEEGAYFKVARWRPITQGEELAEKRALFEDR
jgi:hypothetical protein